MGQNIVGIKQMFVEIGFEQVFFKSPSYKNSFRKQYKPKMQTSRPKHAPNQSRSQYFIHSDYQHSHQAKHHISNTHLHSRSHKRKTSQVSTMSCKSKQRNTSFNQKKNCSSAKHGSVWNTVCLEGRMQKSTKGSERNSIGRKQVFSERNKIVGKNKNTLSLRRQKLKIDTERRAKPKTSHNLTERALNCDTTKTVFKHPAKTHHTSQSSFLNSQKGQKPASNNRQLQSNRIAIPKFKLRQKNLQLMVSRCSHVMTEYYERMTLLKKENDWLRGENEQLRKNQELVVVERV